MTNFLADFFGKQTEFGPRQVLGHKFCIVPDFYLSDKFLGNYKEFDPKLMIRFAPLQKQNKTSKTGKNI